MTLKYTFDIKVHIFDTDCYGPMWHGAYIKWLEMGRVDFLSNIGIHVDAPDAGYIYPVVEQNLKFKSSARLHDELSVTTRVQVDRFKVIFEQTMDHKETGKRILEASTTCVILDQNWKTQRRIPKSFLEKLDSAIAQSKLKETETTKQSLAPC
jgi:acyl-CoA thioester hydrolase